MSEGVEALNAELDDWTARLGAARQQCRDSRPGLADPAEALRELGRTQQGASAFWDDRVRHRTDVDQLSLVDFVRSVALAATQFLEYGHQLSRLPDPHGDGWLDTAATRRLRFAQGRVVVNATKSLALPQLPGFVRLELKGAVLRSAQHALPELAPALPMLARELLAECDRVEASGEPDPISLVPFTRVTALSCLTAQDDPDARQRFLALDPDRLNDPLAAWDLVIGQVAAAATADSAAVREAIIGRFAHAVDWALELVPAQRLARRATAELQVLHGVSALLGIDRNAALRVLDEFGRLCGFSPPGPGTLHLFATSGVLHAVLRRGDDADTVVVTHPVPERQWTELINAVGTDRADEHLGTVRQVVKPVLRELPLADVDSIELDPSSLLSWWPWPVVHTGAGPLGAQHEVRWRTRSRPAAAFAADPTRALIVDTAFREANSVVSAWQRHGGGTILTYDSERPSENGTALREQVLEIFSTHQDVTYFGHASSDPLAVSESGLVLADDLVVPLADLERIATPPRTVTLVACESGRSNLMLTGVSPAHALAAAGAGQIIGTLWPISSRLGLTYLQALFPTRAMEPDLGAAWRTVARTKKDSAAAFLFMGTSTAD